MNRPLEGGFKANQLGYFHGYLLPCEFYPLALDQAHAQTRQSFLLLCMRMLLISNVYNCHDGGYCGCTILDWRMCIVK